MTDYNTYKDEYGVEYSIDRTILIKANPELTEYTVPDGTLIIEEFAFYKCTSLVSIFLPSSLIKVGSEAFRECTSLANLLLPKSLNEISGDAFIGCEQLRLLKIPNSLTINGMLNFYGCNSLEFINIPLSVTEINAYAFRLCRSLKFVCIHSRITRIGTEAFAFCESLCCITHKQLDLENLIITDEEYKILKFFFTPLYLKEIENRAFIGCDKLRNIVFSTSSVIVGQHAFGSLNNNSEINIYSPIRTSQKFKEALISNKCNIHEFTTYLSIIKNPEDSTSVNDLDILYSEKRQDGSLVSLDGTRLLLAPKNCTNYIIPSGIKIICDFAFSRQERLDTIQIPESVVRVGNYAFDHCHNLSMIKLPKGLKSIGDRSFSCCYSLENIIIPYGIKTIPNRAFYYCENLKYINIGSNIERIETRAFYGCSNLFITFVSRDKAQAIDLLKKVDEPRLCDRLSFE